MLPCPMIIPGGALCLLVCLFDFGCAGSALWLVGLSLVVVHMFSFLVARGILVPGPVIEPESAV